MTQLEKLIVDLLKSRVGLVKDSATTMDITNHQYYITGRYDSSDHITKVCERLTKAGVLTVSNDSKKSDRMYKLSEAYAVAGKTEGRCGSCAHWQQSQGNITTGKCNSSKFVENESPDLDGVSYEDYEGYQASFSTGPLFGCIHWKKS